jgi:CHAT domain/SIR2-like domain
MSPNGNFGSQGEADFELGLVWDERQKSFDLFLRFTLGMREDHIRAPREQVHIDLDRLKALRRDPAGYADELTNALFAPEELKNFYHEVMARVHGNVPVHLRLHLDAPDVYHSVRWELLRDPEHPESHLGTSPRVLLSRYLLSNEWRAIKEVNDADLKALAVIAAPSDLDRFELPGRTIADVKREEEVPIAAAALKKYAPRFLSDPGTATIGRIMEELEKGVDVFYLLAHGGLMVGDVPFLLLEAEDGTAEPVDARRLEEVFRDLRRPPALVFLNSCRSAGSGPSARSDDAGLLAALGPRLARAGVPAVVAMQDNVTMQTARAFAQSFFDEFAEGGVVDAAVAMARSHIRERADWWVPVLFSRLRSGRIRYPSGFLSGARQAWDDLAPMASAGKLTPVLGPGLADGIVGSRSEIAANWARRWQMPLPRSAAHDLAQVSQFLKVNTKPGRVPVEIVNYLKTQLAERKQNAREGDPFFDVADDLIGGDRPELAIMEAGRHARRDPDDPYRVVASLKVNVFVTTGWTGLLQAALEAAGKRPFTLTFPWSPGFKEWSKDALYRSWARSYITQEPTVQAPLVYHLFGRLEEPASLVLTQDDYFDWLTAWTEAQPAPRGIPPRVKSALSSNSLLFLGYFLDDWDFRIVFQSIRAYVLQPPRNGHIGVQMRPRGQIVEREAAQRYLESYFGSDKIDIFWVSTPTFVKEMHKRLNLQT